MSMSDDDDEETKDENPGGDADVKDDGDAPERPHPTTSMSLFVLSPPLPSPSCRGDVVLRERNRLPIAIPLFIDLQILDGDARISGAAAKKLPTITWQHD